ncbi:MAG TPA: hypothetical protein VFY71_08550 [Planctomycetota bacterium]|nr:hypothetical protein [Planctomycetota bacterium]
MRALMLVLACALAAPLWAQDAPAPPPRPAPGGGDAGPGGEGPEGGGSGALPQLAPCLHVSGLTLENAEKVSDDLEALENTLYVCPSCHGVAYAAGTCCDKPREERKGLALGSVAPNPSSGTLSFVVAHGRSVRLTELERELAADHIEVLRDRLHLTGRVTLEIQGLADAAAAHSVAEALVAAKLFEEIEVMPPADDGRIALIVKRPAPAPAPLLHVREELAKVAPDASVADVIWTGLLAS